MDLTDSAAVAVVFLEEASVRAARLSTSRPATRRGLSNSSSGRGPLEVRCCEAGLSSGWYGGTRVWLEALVGDGLFAG